MYNPLMVIIKNSRQIDGIRKSSHLAAIVLNRTASLIRPGITTQDLNNAADLFIRQHGATPAPLGYNGYPKSICTSVNDVVCHGIPSSKVILKNGDIINIDITTVLDGYYGDTSATFPVGQPSESARQLIDRTQAALALAVSRVGPGVTVNDCIGKTIATFIGRFGYSVVRDLGGHGVGIKFHEDPFIFHFDTDKNNTILKAGMTFTIEPMINASSDCRVVIDSSDGWTVRTADGSLSAQFEHTVLVTRSGCEVLTKL